MNENAREIFRRMLAQQPLVWAAGKEAVWNEDGEIVTPGEPGHHRERTDDELDQLVAYAVRADAACTREAKRYAAANPLPRPAPPAQFPTPPPPTCPTALPPSPAENLVAAFKRILDGGAR